MESACYTQRTSGIEFTHLPVDAIFVKLHVVAQGAIDEDAVASILRGFADYSKPPLLNGNVNLTGAETIGHQHAYHNLLSILRPLKQLR